MFAKPPNFKPFAAIKNSERKNVLGNIEQQCSIQNWDTDNKQKLLPKGVQSGKGVTHGGEKILVYSDSQLPLWVVVRSTFVPTVAMLATLPAELQLQLLPIVYTRGVTVQFLRNGADFMVPGIVGDLPKGPVPIGSAVQLRDFQNHTLLAIGIAMVDVSKINPEEDKGKCIQTISVVNDKLTPNTDIVEIGNLSVNETPANEGSTTSSVETPSASKSDILEGSNRGDVSSQNAAGTSITASTEKNESDNNEHNEDKQQDDDDADTMDLTTEEIDEAFMYALNRVIRQPTNEYPMPMASVATLLTGYLPYEHHKLAIKNTSYKKMNKLLKHAEKVGLLSCRERQGGEVIVTGVNVPTDPDSVANLVKPQQKKQPKQDKMKTVVVYKPTPAIRQIINVENASEYLDASSLRKYLVEYVSTHNLVSSDHKTVTVDEPLRKALGQKQTVSSVPVGDLAILAVAKCTAFHRVTPLGKSDKDVPLSKGPLPTIQMKTERRGGNKVVTLVGTAGLRGFHIDPAELAEELRHACAGSSTITNVKGFEAIVVQGNHVQKIAKLLEKKGIKQSWIKS